MKIKLQTLVTTIVIGLSFTGHAQIDTANDIYHSRTINEPREHISRQEIKNALMNIDSLSFDHTKHDHSPIIILNERYGFGVHKKGFFITDSEIGHDINYRLEADKFIDIDLSVLQFRKCDKGYTIVLSPIWGYPTINATLSYDEVADIIYRAIFGESPFTIDAHYRDKDTRKTQKIIFSQTK